MLERSAGEIARLCGGQLVEGEAGAAVRGVSVDSRSLAGGELFVALPGERCDGHDFVWRAFSAGAAAALVARPPRPDAVPPGRAVILAEDTYAALGRLAAAHRREFAFPWVAVTGSCGKSTTKELAALALGARGEVLKAQASFNNRVGVPLTLLEARAGHRFAVAELGSSRPGELLPLARMVSPEVAVITCVAPAHLNGFGDLDGVAREKAAVLQELRPGGVAVLNADDPYFGFFRERAPARAVSFGLSAAAEVSARELEIEPEASSFTLPGGSRVRLPLPGRHNVRNALAAAAAALELGLEEGTVAERLAGARPLHMRSRLARCGEVLVLEDCYNANPASFLAALEALETLGRRRRVVVAGDMAELGSCSEEHHRRLGAEIAGRDVAVLVAVGAEARRVAEAAARGDSRLETHWFPDAESAALKAPEFIRPGDAVLVKGSRRVGLEAVSRALERAFGPAGEG